MHRLRESTARPKIDSDFSFKLSVLWELGLVCTSAQAGELFCQPAAK
jgi:hypothetical protein